MSETEKNGKTLSADMKEKDFVEDGKNKLVIKCKFCGSKILEKKSGTYTIQEASSMRLSSHNILFMTRVGTCFIR